MQSILQLENLSKEEFVNIISNLIDSKFKQFKSEDLPEFYTVSEVSDLLAVSKLTVYNYIKNGIIPAKKIERKYIIPRAELEIALREVKSLKYKKQ